MPNVMPFALYCGKNGGGGALFLVYLAQRGDADLERALAVLDADHRLASVAHAGDEMLQLHLERLGLREDRVLHDLDDVAAALAHAALHSAGARSAAQ